MTPTYAQRVSTLYRNTPPVLAARFSEFVLNKLAHAQGNRESVSHLMQEARYDGFKIGGHSTDFVEFLQALGFTVVEEPRGRTIYRYVTL